MISCTVVIVNFNTGELLKDCVASAITNDFVNRIVVVDNYSTDNSMELLMDSEKLTKIYRDINPGFASSCNLGAEKAKTEFLLFLNPDCILLDKETISTLINNLQQNANSAIAGCSILNPDGSEQRASRRRLPTLWRAIKTYSGIEKLAKICHCFAGVNLFYQPMPKAVQKVEAISGALILIKKKVFDEIGGLDENYPLHFEDLDLFKRVKDKGYDVLFNPNVNAVHHQGTSSQFNSKVSGFKKQGLQRYFHKHCSWFSSKIINMLSRFL